MNKDKTRENIVVIGGGFAGLTFAKKIDKSKYHVTLIDCNNYHSFPPLFYQVVSAGLDPSGISFPLRREMRKRSMKKGTTFFMARAREIDISTRTVITDQGRIPYDKLVIAAGSTNNFFNMPQLQDTVYTLKSTSEAIRCRNDILERLERACLESDQVKRREMLNFVVVGGGPSGVEVAGAMGEMKRYLIPREYPQLNQDDVNITLLEGSDRVLRTMSSKSSTEAKQYLESLMVNVKLDHNMKSYNNGKIQLDDDTTIPASMVIWTAGVRGAELSFSNDSIKAGRGLRFEVDEYCRVIGANDIYALGDIALMVTPEYPAGHPQLAQVAIQQAKMVAANLNRGHIGTPFHYKDKGTMATVGRNRAVVDMKHVHFKGWCAWMVWMGVHLVSLLGMRNKLSVFLDWVWSYFTYSNSTRLLMKPSKSPSRQKS